MPESELLMFTGRECTHCHAMEPLVERLQEETGKSVQKLEVWHDEKNAKFMMQCDKGYCGGVPFFFNKKTGKWICGETSYENLKKWAMGK